MSTSEIIRCFDILVHFFLFMVLIWEAIDSPQHRWVFNTVATVTAMLSLFLAFTRWNYGKAQFFLALHTLWEYGILALIILFIFHVKRKKDV